MSLSDELSHQTIRVLVIDMEVWYIWKKLISVRQTPVLLLLSSSNVAAHNLFFNPANRLNCSRAGDMFYY
jgi:hypothetical protein